MAKRNAINNKGSSLTIEPGASGDSFVQFDINATGEFRIGVDDTDDSFRISQGSALGTNDTFVMSAAGERTMPLQPAFLAYLGTTDEYATGDGTVFTLGSGNALTEVYDQGGDFVTTGTFTAPVTGFYSITCSVRGSYIDALSSYKINVVTSNGSYQLFYGWMGSVATPDTEYISTGSVYCDMDSSDTATVTITGSGSAKEADIYVDSDRSTSIAGHLIC